jgi:hypothetical protein
MTPETKNGPPANRFALDRPEGVSAVWEQMILSLSKSGFQAAGPEYLRLSQLVLQSRRAALLGGAADAAQWDRLRQLGGQAMALMQPLMEAARILAELPMTLSASPAEPTVSTPESSAPAEDPAPRNQAATKKKPAQKSSAAAK